MNDDRIKTEREAVRLEAMELRRILLPLRAPFRISSGVLRQRESLIVKLSFNGTAGYGESAPMPEPFYSYETPKTVWHIIQDVLWPRMKHRPWGHPDELSALWSDVRGHPFAKAGVETAAWDAWARRHSQPLAHVLGHHATAIPSGVALSVPMSMEDLLEQVEQAIARGYRRVKIKIRPGWDVKPVEAIRKAHPDLPLMVDANAAYRLADRPIFRQLDEFGLTMIEQPLAYDDLLDHAELQKDLITPICLDESIHHVADVRAAAKFGSCRIVNIKIQRVGGLQEARAVHDACAEAGLPVWCGTMPETGIGQRHGLALAGLPNFLFPADLEPSDQFFTDDVVSPPLTLLPDGTIPLPEGPGIGSVDEEKLERYTVEKVLLK